jgi:outer membrane protein OmpA-like peptidoglycan-associated protein
MGYSAVRKFSAGGFILIGALFSGVIAQFEPAPVISLYGQAGLEHTESAKSLGFGRLVIGAHGDMSLDNGFCTKAVTDDTTLIPSASQYNVYPFLSIGIAKILDFSAILPVYFDNINKSAPDTSFGGVQGGIGDCELKLKLQVPPHNHPRLADLGFSVGMSLPTGDRNHGYFPRHSYYFLKDSTLTSARGDIVAGRAGFFSSGIPEFDARILITLNGWEQPEFTRLMLHMNYGLHIFAQRGFDDVFVFNAGLEYHPAYWIGLFAELSAEPRLHNLLNEFNPGKDPLRITPGITLTPGGGLFLTMTSDIGLSSQYPVVYSSQNAVVSARVQPAWRVGASIGWAGFLNRSWHGGETAFPTVKSFDRDNDGVPDSIDKCPNVPEDKDGFEDADGCPDNDNDKDGVRDSVDQCPNDTEDFDGFEDADGCPDPDNDKDGVCDPWVAEKGLQKMYEKVCTGTDKCPNLPEDIDGFEDADGCPDPDNDLDGVPDSIDKCPNVAGPADNAGCPKGSGMSASSQQAPQGQSAVKEIRRGRLILKGVGFVQGTADMVPESYSMIDNVYESLKVYPDVKIEISGYTDNTGNPLENRKLSQRRADKVREYLVLHGIDPGRITAVGKGGEDPLVDNKTPEGRAFNRRIEMRRID